MKILVFAHRLEVGGSQVNAIELAAALRDHHGHDVVMFAIPGPMIEMIKQKGLKFIPAPVGRFRPGPRRMRALRNAVRSERPDLLHVWDWWQCLDAYYGEHLMMRMPMLVSDMMMELTRILPKQVPITFGTPELVHEAEAKGYRRAELMLPPVDVHWNAPNVVDPQGFRARYGIGSGEVTIVTVSRLHPLLKGESLRATLQAIRVLGRDVRVRFIIAGEGPAQFDLERVGQQINAELGRPAVVFTGALLDPRPAYAAADIVVGMGGSSLRGMAFEKPVIVVGENGFAAPMSPETAQFFYHKGLYGRGTEPGGATDITTHLRQLIDDPHRRDSLGRFSRNFVVQHFALETVSAHLSRLCHKTINEVVPLSLTAADAVRTTAVYIRERKYL